MEGMRREVGLCTQRRTESLQVLTEEPGSDGADGPIGMEEIRRRRVEESRAEATERSGTQTQREQ